MGMRNGKTSGKGLKPGLNMADTGSVVDTVKGTVAFGRFQRPDGNNGSQNRMISGNTGLKNDKTWPRASNRKP